YLQREYAAHARGMTVVVRTRADAASIAPLLRAAVSELDKDQPVGAVRTMGDLIDDSVAPRRLNLLLLAAFAGIALVLTAEGLYGVMAYIVTQRTHEIGIRVALGASRENVLGLIFRQAGVLLAAGIALGLAGALALTRFLATLLFGVSPADPVVYLTVAALLAAVGCLAVAVPSLRASRVDPLDALRGA